jgi:hypothetical protein
MISGAKMAIGDDEPIPLAQRQTLLEAYDRVEAIMDAESPESS